MATNDGVKLSDFEECSNCSYPAPKHLVETRRIHGGETIALCEVCYSTFLGHATIYVRMSNEQLAQAIGYCVNLILAELRNGRQAKVP
jgi:hypothetical protein